LDAITIPLGSLNDSSNKMVDLTRENFFQAFNKLKMEIGGNWDIKGIRRRQNLDLMLGI